MKGTLEAVEEILKGAFKANLARIRRREGEAAANQKGTFSNGPHVPPLSNRDRPPKGTRGIQIGITRRQIFKVHQMKCLVDLPFHGQLGPSQRSACIVGKQLY